MSNLLIFIIATLVQLVMWFQVGNMLVQFFTGNLENRWYVPVGVIILTSAAIWCTSSYVQHVLPLIYKL